VTRLLRPSWLALHVLVAAAAVVMVRLGVWQWGRGEASGSLRNYSYGLEWWAFAGLTLVAWVKFCLDETRDVAGTPPEAQAAEPEPAYVRPVVDVSEDPELAAYNAHLAELARRDVERAR